MVAGAKGRSTDSGAVVPGGTDVALDVDVQVHENLRFLFELSKRAGTKSIESLHKFSSKLIDAY